MERGDNLTTLSQNTSDRNKNNRACNFSEPENRKNLAQKAQRRPRGLKRQRTPAPADSKRSEAGSRAAPQEVERRRRKVGRVLRTLAGSSSPAPPFFADLVTLGFELHGDHAVLRGGHTRVLGPQCRIHPPRLSLPTPVTLEFSSTWTSEGSEVRRRGALGRGSLRLERCSGRVML